MKNFNQYCMTIENENFRNWKMWNDVIKFWYNKAIGKNFNIDKLYHHLTILICFYILQQLLYYAKFLTCVTLFKNVKINIIVFFTSILHDKKSMYYRFLFFKTVFIKIHEVLYCERLSNKFSKCFYQIKKNLLKHYIEKITTKFKKQNVFVIIVCIASLFENKLIEESSSSKSNFCFVFEKMRTKRMKKQKTISMQINDQEFDVDDSAIRFSSISTFENLTSFNIWFSRNLISQIFNFAFICFSIVLNRPKNKNIYFLIRIYFVFFWNFVTIKRTMKYVKTRYFLNENLRFF